MRDSILFTIIFLTFLTCSSNIVYADDSSIKSLNASRIQSPVHLDGRLREPAWETAAPATGSTQRELTEGAPATKWTVMSNLQAMTISPSSSTRSTQKEAKERKKIGTRILRIERVSVDTNNIMNHSCLIPM